MTGSDNIDLNHLIVFATVAEAGGFTAAAERLGISKARVSLAVARLEAQLGTTLFSRTTRRVTLTEAGEAAYARCVPPLREAREALETLHEGDSPAALRGNLRIAAPTDHATLTLARVVAAFSARHPQLNIELRSSDRVIDLVEEGIDLAIRAGWLRDSSMRSTQLGEFDQYVVCSPAYLQRHAAPTLPEDLSGHDWIALSLLPTPLTWTFSHAGGDTRVVRMNARLRTDSVGTLRAFLRHGAGVSVLDTISARPALESGELVRLLPDWQLPRGGIHAVFPPGRHIPAKARAFVDFYRAEANS